MQCGEKIQQFYNFSFFVCFIDIQANVTDKKKQMETVLCNLDVRKCQLNTSGCLVRLMCCSVCDGVLWACLRTDCDRKQFVRWIDGSGDVEQSDEIMSVSPPPARSQHPLRPKTNLNNFLSSSFSAFFFLPVIFPALFASIFSVRP